MNTETAHKAREWCSQHRQPLADCNPWDRHGHSNRFREDDWQATERGAEKAGMTATDRIAYGMQVQDDRLRCGRGGCVMDGPAIPVIWGDLTGKTLGQWIAEAVKTIEDQHPRHEPVLIGAASARTLRFREPAVKP
jgi:hypothetical protein